MRREEVQSWEVIKCSSVCLLCVPAQVDDMVQQSGVFSRKTAQERETERRVKERQQELLEYYRTRQREIVSSATASHTELRVTSVDRGGEPAASSPLGRREGRTETMTDASQASNSLYPIPSAEKRSYSEERYEKKVLSAASSRQDKGCQRKISASSHQFAPGWDVNRENQLCFALL